MKSNHAPATKSVGIWIRVSTEDQAQGDSPQHHELRAREYAKFNGWNVREVYDLAGATRKNRGQVELPFASMTQSLGGLFHRVGVAAIPPGSAGCISRINLCRYVQLRRANPPATA